MKKSFVISAIASLGLLSTASPHLLAMGRSNGAPSRIDAAQTDEHTGMTGGAEPSRTTHPIGGTGSEGAALDASRHEKSGMGSQGATPDVLSGLKGEPMGGAGSSNGKTERGRAQRTTKLPDGASAYPPGEAGVGRR